MDKRSTIPALLLAASTLFGCGGGGGGGGPRGVFLDGPVEGVSYFSGEIAGTTGPGGTFRYGAGQTVMFSIGDVVLGVASAKATMTPVDLVPGATDELDESVTNIARFLQTIDFDLDPTNGIQVDQVVRDAAVGVTIDFTQAIATFQAGEQAKVDTLTAGLPGGPRALVPTADAQEHLGLTLRSIVAGRYDGSYAGDDSGPFSVYVDRDGVLSGWAVSAFDGVIGLMGSADTLGGFLAGNASTGATFTGQIEADGSLAGTWTLGVEAGTFQGRRTVPLDAELDEDLIEDVAGTYGGTFDSNFGSEAFTATFDDEGNLSLPGEQVSGTVISTDGDQARFRALIDEGCELRGTLDRDGSLEGTLRNDLTGEVGTFEGTKT